VQLEVNALHFYFLRVPRSKLIIQALKTIFKENFGMKNSSETMKKTYKEYIC